jgi:hypothetical protein
MIDEQRLEVANQVLEAIEQGIRLVKKGSYLNAEWDSFRGKPVSKRWSTDRKGAFFPSFNLPTGGTHTTAITQLVYWVRHQPCLPIESWKYWVSPVIGMKGGDVILPLLESADYPKGVACVCCKGPANLGDWYYNQGLQCLPCFNEGEMR